MGYSIKKHEVQRVAVILRQLGWKVIAEKVEERDITLTITRHLPDELLKAAGELTSGS